MSGETEPRLQRFREFYASLIAGDPRVRSAFASVPREKYLGEGPWQVRTPTGYVDSPVSDPAFLYQDILVALISEGPINNGQPSLHALCLTALKVQEGETAVHVGAGTGYYTAMLAELVGPSGRVLAYEIEPSLAERARSNLAEFSHVEVFHRSGSEGPLPECDVLYVNAGATDPLPAWLDALRVGGRLLFPLTPDEGYGGMLLIKRDAEEKYGAEFLCQTLFIPCEGARNKETGGQLREAFRSRRWTGVKSLRRGSKPDGTCWFAGDGWWLSTTPSE